MPANHSFRLYYDQGILPGKKPGKKHQNKASSVVGTSRLYLPFGIQRELSPEKEVFSPHGIIGTYNQRYKSKRIQRDSGQNRYEMIECFYYAHDRQNATAGNSGKSDNSQSFSSLNQDGMDFLRSTAGRCECDRGRDANNTQL
jgi:hypothetical protein